MMSRIDILKYFLFTVFLSVLSAQGYTTDKQMEKTLSPFNAINMLKEGNLRFVSTNKNPANQNKERRVMLAEYGQRPFAMILGCSDSRTPVEQIFDVGIGDLFVVRVAGFIADSDVTGTFEYGAKSLKIPLLVVLGHNSCDTITTAINNDKNVGNYSTLIEKIKPAVEKAEYLYGNKISPALIEEAVKQNIWLSMENLITSSSVLRNMIRNNKLKIVGANYNLDTGIVEWLGEHPRQAEFLSGSKSEAVKETVYNDETSANAQGFKNRKMNFRPLSEKIRPVPETGRENSEVMLKTRIILSEKGNKTGKTGLPLSSPRNPLLITIFISAPENTKKAEIEVFASRSYKSGKYPVRELIFRLGGLIIKDGKGQTQFYWAAKNLDNKYLNTGIYRISVKIKGFNADGEKLGATADKSKYFVEVR